MHIRYDLKNKLNLDNFKTQSFFFLDKEDCTFSFYLNEISISFDVAKAVDLSTKNNFFKINFVFAESDPNPIDKTIYKVINPNNDARIKDIGFLNDIFNGEYFTTEKKSKQEVYDFILFMLNAVRKFKKLSVLA